MILPACTICMGAPNLERIFHLRFLAAYVELTAELLFSQEYVFLSCIIISCIEITESTM